MPVIDIHPHIVSPDTKRYPLAPLGGTQSTWSSERPTTYQTLLGAMDDVGIDKAAIVHSSTAYGYDNSYVTAAVAAVPSRFTAVCSIDVMAPDAVKTRALAPIIHERAHDRRAGDTATGGGGVG